MSNGCGSCFLNPPDQELRQRGHHSSKFCGLWIEIESLWGQQSESLDSVAFFHFVIASFLRVNLFNYENRKILQGVSFRVKISSHWFFQISMFNIRSMAIHSYVERILCFSNILFVTFDHIDHIGCFTVC